MILERAFIRQLKSSDAGWKKLKPIKGILQAEVRLMKPKAVRAYTDADDVSGQIADLLKDSRNIFLDTFTQIIPFGDFYKKDKAVEIIRKEVADSIMRRRMLRLLVLIPEGNAPSRTESHELPEYRENNGFICQNKPVACYDQ